MLPMLFMVKMRYRRRRPKDNSVVFVLEISVFVVVDQLREKIDEVITKVE